MTTVRWEEWSSTMLPICGASTAWIDKSITNIDGWIDLRTPVNEGHLEKKNQL